MSNDEFNMIGGQEVDAINITGADGATPTSATWTVSGNNAYSSFNPLGGPPIVPYQYSQALNPVAYTGQTNTLDANSMADQITFYWGSQPGTYTVSVTVNFTQGPAATSQMQVTVQAPTVTSFTDSQQGVIAFSSTDANNNQQLTIENAYPQQDGTIGNNGETFNATVSAANMNSGLGTGSYFLLQLVTPSTTIKGSSNNNNAPGTFTTTFSPPQANTPMLDSGSPLGNAITLIPAGQAGNSSLFVISDSPFDTITASDAADYAANNGSWPTSYQRNDSFQTYVMFQTQSGMPVALGEVDWTYAFTATFMPQPAGQPLSANYYTSPNSWNITGTSPQGNPNQPGQPVIKNGNIQYSIPTNYVGIATGDIVEKTTTP